MKNKKLFIDKIACVILTLAMVFSLNINSFFIFAAELDTNSTENNIESSIPKDEREKELENFRESIFNFNISDFSSTFITIFLY